MKIDVTASLMGFYVIMISSMIVQGNYLINVTYNTKMDAQHVTD